MSRISRFVRVVSPVLVLLAGLVPGVVPGPVRAQAQAITILSSSTVANFPLSLEFKLRAQSTAEINFVALNYRVDRLNFARVTNEIRPKFKPGTTVDTSWKWDMRLGNLPTGARLEYWWTVGDAAGRRLRSEPKSLEFADNRHQWKSITEGLVTVSWYEGDEAFGRQVMKAVQSALERLGRDVGARLDRPARMFVYRNADELQQALIYPRGWEGGVTIGDFGTILFGIAPNGMVQGERDIAHEVTHLLIDQITFGPYSDVPRWLNEGLAVYNEGPFDPNFAALLEQARSRGSLISVRSLSAPFPSDPREAFLSYAESRSIAAFMLAAHGRDKMSAVLEAFKHGALHDDGLKKVYGFDMDGLDKLWRESLGKTASARRVPVLAAWRPASGMASLLAGWAFPVRPLAAVLRSPLPIRGAW